MKDFLKKWIFPPQGWKLLINLKSNLRNRLRKNLFDDSFRGHEKGNRCFIVGTGSSIKSQDLKLLKNETVIGVSGLFRHKDINIINPKYYINPPVFKSHGKYFNESEFISYLSDMDQALADETIMFMHIGDKPYIEKYQLFKNKKIIWNEYQGWDGEPISEIHLSSMPSVWSVSESAIQVALYLGFDEIYLLGFDHDWFNGTFVYFTNNYHKSFDAKKVKKIDEEVDSEFQMVRHAQIFNKYKKLYALKENIYNANANPNSYVDVFPKIKYEDLFLG